MTRDEAVRYACRIKALVWRTIDSGGHTASDCFCEDSPGGPGGFRDEGAALAYILEAVRAKLADDGYVADEQTLLEILSYEGRRIDV